MLFALIVGNSDGGDVGNDCCKMKCYKGFIVFRLYRLRYDALTVVFAKTMMIVAVAVVRTGGCR